MPGYWAIETTLYAVPNRACDAVQMWLIILFFLPSVAYDPEGFQKLDRLQKTYKISWNDPTPHQRSNQEKLRWSVKSACSTDYYYYLA